MLLHTQLIIDSCRQVRLHMLEQTYWREQFPHPGGTSPLHNLPELLINWLEIHILFWLHIFLPDYLNPSVELVHVVLICCERQSSQRILVWCYVRDKHCVITFCLSCTLCRLSLIHISNVSALSSETATIMNISNAQLLITQVTQNIAWILD